MRAGLVYIAGFHAAFLRVSCGNTSVMRHSPTDVTVVGTVAQFFLPLSVCLLVFSQVKLAGGRSLWKNIFGLVFFLRAGTSKISNQSILILHA